MIHTECNSPLPRWLSRWTPLKALCHGYLFIVKHRNKRYDLNPSLSYKPDNKVISVGGIRAGGTGKTPVAHMIGQYLISKQFDVAYLSRGYRRKVKTDVIVHPGEKTDWEKVGDEPAMLHSLLPQSWLGISAKRAGIAAKLSKHITKRTVFVLDDGFQHRQIKRDLDIVCINDFTLYDKMMPCGFLREPIDSLARADAIVLTGSREASKELEMIRDELQVRFPRAGVVVLTQNADCWVNAATGEIASKPPLRNPVALCGIARPERFFNMLRSEGITPCRKIALRDHYIYTEKYFNSIHELYSHGMITTEKDAFRLQNKVVICPDFWYLKISLNFLDLKSQECFNRLMGRTISNI